ncbi:hypothetical protein EDD22DRAFT_136010 [Suillus occidentalis]|nr:hypothetical protein EDD22DRAFT_136010 [Suillus occidentalis]
MRFSSAIVLAVVAALASSVSATPMNANVEHCEQVCVHDYQCDTSCMAGISSLLGLEVIVSYTSHSRREVLYHGFLICLNFALPVTYVKLNLKVWTWQLEKIIWQEGLVARNLILSIQSAHVSPYDGAVILDRSPGTQLWVIISDNCRMSVNVLAAISAADLLRDFESYVVQCLQFILPSHWFLAHAQVL